MRCVRRSRMLWIVGAVLPALAGQDSRTPSSWFDYEPSEPLGYTQVLLLERDGVQIYDSSYASPMGGRARAYTVMPTRGGRSGAVVWQHGGGQFRNWFLPDAVAFAKAGAVSILLDAPANRPAEMRRPGAAGDLESFRRDMVQVAVDARRAYDVLAAMPQVDKNRIGYVGLSFGAMMGGSLAGVDKRFKTFVLISGLEGFARHYRVSEHPNIVALRKRIGPEDLEKLIATVEPIDARNFIRNSSPSPLLFQAARFDIGVSEADTRSFFGMAGEPKFLKWYDSGHDLNDPKAFADRQAWLRKHLRLK